MEVLIPTWGGMLSIRSISKDLIRAVTPEACGLLAYTINRRSVARRVSQPRHGPHLPVRRYQSASDDDRYGRRLTLIAPTKRGLLWSLPFVAGANTVLTDFISVASPACVPVPCIST